MPKQFLPSPGDVATAFVQLTQDPFAGYTLQQHLLSSLWRFALGFGLAAIVGIPLGLLMGWFGWLDDIVTPVFESVRFIAPLAWVPFAALWFGTGIGGPILVIFSGAFPPCVINAHRGARLIETRLVEAAATLGAGTYRTFVDVLVPGAPAVDHRGPAHQRAGLAWQSLVGAELIVVSAGIGYMMVQGQSNLATAIVVRHGRNRRGGLRHRCGVASGRAPRAPAVGGQLSQISFSKVSRIFGRTEQDFVAIDDVSLEIADREFVAIVGPSGCGKTTLMRMAAGLDFPSAGSVRVGGKEVLGRAGPRGGVPAIRALSVEDGARRISASALNAAAATSSARARSAALCRADGAAGA